MGMQSPLKTPRAPQQKKEVKSRTFINNMIKKKKNKDKIQKRLENIGTRKSDENLGNKMRRRLKIVVKSSSMDRTTAIFTHPQKERKS